MSHYQINYQNMRSVKKVKFIEIKSEIGAGTRGASVGPEAIKIAALDMGSNMFNEHESVEVKNENHLLFSPTGSIFARRIKGLITIYERLSVEVSKAIKGNFFPIVLAGDHSTAAGTIAGVRLALPPKNTRIGVIWIDAHADLHSPYTTPSGNMHGMPLAVALGEDNKSNQINKVDKETIDLWNKLKSIGGNGANVRYEDLVYIAVRDLEPEETALMRNKKIKLFSTDEIRLNGVERIARDTLAYLKACTHIYISFDVDSMDSSISRGTGTPVPHGITEKEAGSLLVRLMQNEKVVCLEVTEVNPTLDKENLMAENTFEILQKVIGQFT
jgi:arginase